MIASGGLSTLADIERLCAVEDDGIDGVICGRAIYSGDLDFAAAQARADELAAPDGRTVAEAHALPCSPNASFPASTSPAAASSRASTSSSCATPAIRSRSRARYNEQGADELTFLDITATSDGRDLILHIIEAVASQVFIPLTVGGGVRTRRRRAAAAQRRRRQGQLQLGRGRRTRSSSATRRRSYGAQCIVVAIDAKRARRRPAAGTSTPTAAARNTGLDAVDWARAHGRRSAPARSC